MTFSGRHGWETVMGILSKLFGKGKGGDRRSVLVVDDDGTSRRLISMYLDQCDLNAAEAGSVADAVKKVEGAKSPFRLFVLDIVLPDGDGIGLARRLQKIPAANGRPILFVSSNFPPSQMEKLSKEFPHSKALTKPFKSPVFKGAVTELLGETAKT